MSNIQQASSVLVINKTTGARQRLTPQVHPLVQRIQAEYDIACSIAERALVKIHPRAALAELFS